MMKSWMAKVKRIPTPLIFAWGLFAGAAFLSVVPQPVRILAAALQGDINGDGKVDIVDLSILLSNFGKTASPSPTSTPPPTPGPTATAYPIPAGSTLLRKNDFEDGKENSWDNTMVFETSPDRWTVDTGVPLAAQGTWRARAEVRAGDPQIASGYRSQLSSGIKPNNHQYLSCFRFLIPGSSDLPGQYGSNAWKLIWEQHTVNIGGSPPLALFVDGTKGQPVTLSHAAGDGSRSDWSKAGVALDTWHHFCAKYYQSTSSGTGWLELWLDGQWQTLNSGQQRKAFATAGASVDGLYVLGGIYRGGGHGGTSIIYTDDYQEYRVGP